MPINIDIEPWLRTLRDMSRRTPSKTAAMTAVGHRMFRDTQEKVHVITSSLKNSGDVTSRWEGRAFIVEITYGGDSGGSIHDPVNYAIFEMARGSNHDFFRALPEYYEEFEQAMLGQAIL